MCPTNAFQQMGERPERGDGQRKTGSGAGRLPSSSGFLSVQILLRDHAPGFHVAPLSSRAGARDRQGAVEVNGSRHHDLACESLASFGGERGVDEAQVRLQGVGARLPRLALEFAVDAAERFAGGEFEEKRSRELIRVADAADLEETPRVPRSAPLRIPVTSSSRSSAPEYSVT
jgi:hypothetical protein